MVNKTREILENALAWWETRAGAESRQMEGKVYAFLEMLRKNEMLQCNSEHVEIRGNHTYATECMVPILPKSNEYGTTFAWYYVCPRCLDIVEIWDPNL